MKRWKKLCIGALIVMAVCFVGALIALPFAFQRGLDQLNRYEGEVERVDIDPTVSTVVLNGDGAYGEILVRQSETGQAYLDIYGSGLPGKNEVVLIYPETGKAEVYVSHRFGQNHWSLEELLRQISFEAQDYPDAVLYITPEQSLEYLPPDYGYTNFSFDGPLHYANEPNEPVSQSVVGNQNGVYLFSEDAALAGQMYYEQGRQEGYAAGYEDGFQSGADSVSMDWASDDRYDVGYQDGYDAGYRDGVGTSFEEASSAEFPEETASFEE